MDAARWPEAAPTSPRVVSSTSVSGPAVDGVDDALDELVNQFSDPLSFLRELVQNAIDAGSHEVEITTSFEPEGEEGLALIEVADWGGGMSREIIETKLTRLFSSEKDGDRTKIGKFGIGFVSVFAIVPDVVCVDTARDGESWRVLFDAHRSFKLLRLDEPIEGTRIRVYKTMSEPEADTLTIRVYETVEYWCKHAQCDIRVDGRSIAVPFEFDAPCSVVHDDGYSRISVGHTLEHASFLGLYNGGLTLMEGTVSPYPGVAVRAWSPHLEHTLARDAVIEDAGHARVMQAVRDTVEGPLVVRTFEELDAELRRPRPSTHRAYLLRCALWHVERGIGEVGMDAIGDRAVAMSPSGRPLSLRFLRDGVPDGVVLLTRERGPLCDALEARGSCVAVGALDRADGAFLARFGQRAAFEVEALENRWALALRLRDDEDPASFAPLAQAARTLFEDAGFNVAALEFGHLDYPGSSLKGVVAIAQREPYSLARIDELERLGEGYFSRARTVIVNADHAMVRALLRTARKDVALAAYMLAKAFFLVTGLTPTLDGKLASAAAKMGAA